MMKVVVVHYHLRRGGVTRVIQHAAASLAEHGVELAVLCGEAPGELRDFPPVQVVPALGYNGGEPVLDPLALAEELKAAAMALLGGPPDVWHIHNHSLGKKRLLSGCAGASGGGRGGLLVANP